MFCKLTLSELAHLLVFCDETLTGSQNIYHPGNYTNGMHAVILK